MLNSKPCCKLYALRRIIKKVQEAKAHLALFCVLIAAEFCVARSPLAALRMDTWLRCALIHGCAVYWNMAVAQTSA